MLHAAGRIDDDEVVLVRSSNFLELTTRFPALSSATMICMANVDLPLPPFWFPMTTT
jgi:hypothetical protein